MASTDLPTIADVHAAAVRIAGHAVRTPLVASAVLDDIAGGRVLLKCESLQRTGSFKFRGAYNALAALPPERRANGVVAVSSGNHAQGVAEAARLFGIPATIVMPADAPAIKRARTERSGARVVAYDRDREDREVVATHIMADTGGTLIHPYNNADVIAGQGTIGLEIMADVLSLGVRPDAVLVPCGGGGLSAGIGLAVRSAGAADLVWSSPTISTTTVVRSPPDGSSSTRPWRGRCAMRFSPRRRARSVSRSIAPTERSPRRSATAEALAAVAFAFNELKLVVEPGGAVALAAVLSGRVDDPRPRPGRRPFRRQYRPGDAAAGSRSRLSYSLS